MKDNLRKNLMDDFQTGYGVEGSEEMREKVKGKKLAMLCVAAMMFTASGCSSDMQTREEIVVPRQEAAWQTGDGGMEAASQQGTEGTAAELVQAPEHYKWEGSSGVVSVKADAAVVIPKADGFKTYKVTSRVFTQEDYDRVSGVLLNGASLWDRDYERMEGSNGFTLEEVENNIALLEKQKAESVEEAVKDKRVNAKEIDYDARIDNWRALAKEAPREAIIIEVPEIVAYDGSGTNAEENYLGGMATVNGEDFHVSLDNNLSDTWRWISFQIRCSRVNSNFYNFFDEQNGSAQAAEIDRAKARQKAQETVEAMGFTDFALAGEEYVQAVSVEEKEGNVHTDVVGYAFYFTRMIDGIPVTYTANEGGTLENDDIVVWPYERLELVYDPEGFASFNWVNPYHVEKVSDEYLFLLRVSEIQDIFEEMILKKYGDIYEEADKMKLDFFIDEVRLGYMRVFEKGNPMEGEMIPVWDFFGREVFCPEGKEPMTDAVPYASRLTINAMDGTIIDRDLGY